MALVPFLTTTFGNYSTLGTSIGSTQGTFGPVVLSATSSLVDLRSRHLGIHASRTVAHVAEPTVPYDEVKLIGSTSLNVTSPAQVVASVQLRPATLIKPAYDVPPPPPPPPPPPVVQPAHVIEGMVSWYGSRAGTCASPYLPFGTVVTIRYGDASTTCVVDDRGPYIDGRSLDLSPATSAQVAWLGTGVIYATLSW